MGPNAGRYTLPGCDPDDGLHLPHGPQQPSLVRAGANDTIVEAAEIVVDHSWVSLQIELVNSAGSM
jgi:hypothetical protein